jgi:DNA-binding CsgD family transcriptional regulator
MDRIDRLVKFASIGLIGAGILFLAVSYATGGKVNIALPLVFLMLGAGFFALVFVLMPKWIWASLLYIPGTMLLALGVIFLLNEITGDLGSWAYAWLLLVAGAGLGLVLANREELFRRELTLIGWGMALGGVTLFALFGAIAGGPFIQMMAPIMLVLGGLLLRRLRPASVLPKNFLQRLNPVPGQAHAIDQTGLVEPLSPRELEVLRLVDNGLSNAEIAGRLVLASSTVKTHINNIYGKLDVQTRLQAVKRARELGLLEP